jgi:hypothetical protein
MAQERRMTLKKRSLHFTEQKKKNRSASNEVKTQEVVKWNERTKFQVLAYLKLLLVLTTFADLDNFYSDLDPIF